VERDNERKRQEIERKEKESKTLTKILIAKNLILSRIITSTMQYKLRFIEIIKSESGNVSFKIDMQQTNCSRLDLSIFWQSKYFKVS